MPYEREPAETYKTQVAKLKDTAERLASIKPNERELKLASEELKKCNDKIENIYIKALTDVKSQEDTSIKETSIKNTSGYIRGPGGG